MNDLFYRVAELERLLANVVRLGTVEELDEAAARVKVGVGPIQTGWLPWVTRRAGGDRDWWAPEVGEQVVLLSPGGELAQAVVMPAIYQTAHPAPAASKDKRRVEFADGGFVEYDRSSGKLDVNAKGDADINAGGKVKITAASDVEIDGGSGEVKGIVQGDCLCVLTGKPHPHISSSVKGSF